jgi:uroporphyrin-III C-methyltransferase/precorrin-2 dehydrogenase/sirohydrochlorin ferrochelatase
MNYLPLFHDLRDKRCLIVGGGQVALRKLRVLTEAGVVINLVAPEIDPVIQARAGEFAGMTIHLRKFHPDDLDGVALVVVATQDQELNKTVAALAQDRDIDVNVVDQPQLCTVIFPAIVNRTPIQVAVSSGGTSPILTRMLRAQIESILPAGLGKLAELIGSYRGRVKAALHSAAARRAFWEGVLESNIPEQVYSGNTDTACEMLDNSIKSEKGDVAEGEVYLVGGGPGDPDLLTFRALRLMQRADVVLYDRLVSRQVLDMVRRDAEQIFVGKKAGSHPVTQANINDKLVELARQGKRVLRLKGGDPFIFGRGGEEIEQLAEHGIRFQVVPGITAASGCASFAGIPLTHRDYSDSVRFIAGHKRDQRLDLDWAGLINARETLVFYMSLSGLEEICSKLVANGLSADTPAALIENGTLSEQRVFTGNLTGLPGIVRENHATAPTLLIVGQVVRLHKKLGWFALEHEID